MRFISSSFTEEADPAFPALLLAESGQQPTQCYQCGECTAGCPLASEMDIPPNRLMRMVQAGLRRPVLESSTIWLCASCQTCTARCPRQVDLARVMDGLRAIAIREGVRPKLPEVLAFHQAFLRSVEGSGRCHELGLVMRYKLATRKFLQDMALGMKMFAKGKLPLAAHRIKGQAQVKRIFERTK